MKTSETNRSGRINKRELLASLPDVNSTLAITGLRGPVTIVRDGWGVPHIKAESEWDAFMGQGFATAQDRLWHMEYDLRRSLGEWAEWAGPSGTAHDLLWRRLDIERAAKADLQAAGKPAVEMLEAYCAGVNAFIETTDSLPVEYRILDATPEPWSPWHCLAAYKVRNLIYGVWEMKLWRARLANEIGPEAASRLFRGYEAGHLITTPPGEVFDGPELEGLDDLIEAVELLGDPAFGDGGSNAWVIGGELTESGMPLVAGDSHRALDTPNVYYQVHLSCPEWRVSGYSLPGVPGAPHFSHTEYVAWGMTHGYADYQDLFVEKFRNGPENRLEYKAGRKWTAAEHRVEEIRIRGAAPQPISVVRTRHGPVILGDPKNGSGVAFSHPGTNSGTPWANTLLGLLRARNADEIEESLRDWTEPVNNFVYADRDGEFGYRYRGRIPIRSMSNAWRPIDGSGNEHEWGDEIPFEDMPATRNPAAGWVVTCNQRVTGDDYPYYIALEYAPDFRARRVTSHIGNWRGGKADVQAMGAMHADRVSLPGLTFARVAAGLSVTDEPLANAVSLLKAWDGSMEVDSPAAAVYGAARAHLLSTLAGILLGSLADEGTSSAGRGAFVHLSQIFSRAVADMESENPSFLPRGHTWGAIVRDSLAAAVRELTDRLGGDMASWRWGDIHRTNPQHPLSPMYPEAAELLDPPGFEYGGDAETPQAAAYSFTDRFNVSSTSSNRYIHDTGDWNRSLWVVPLGTSGHPGSPHYADQAPLWATVRYVPQLWDWDDIEKNSESRQQLIPVRDSE